MSARNYTAAGIIMQKEGLISISTLMSIMDDVKRKYKLKEKESQILLDSVYKAVDLETSTFSLDIYWKDSSEDPIYL